MVPLSSTANKFAAHFPSQYIHDASTSKECLEQDSSRPQVIFKHAIFEHSNIEASNIVRNVDMRIGEVRQFLPTPARRRCTELVEVSEFDAGGDIVLCMSQINLSTRDYQRILKLSRTIAEGIKEIRKKYDELAG